MDEQELPVLPGCLQLEKYFYLDKAFAYTPPQILSCEKLSEKPPSDWMDYLKNNHDLLQKHLDKHVGKESFYLDKNDLIQSLEIIYYRLTKKFDQQLGELSNNERVALFTKLTEEITECSEGFHNRVKEIINSFSKPKNFSQLLQLAREDLVQRTAVAITKNVHSFNTIICIANIMGFGVRPGNANDQYSGWLENAKILISLEETFNKKFTPFYLPILISDQLKTILGDAYKGKKSDEGYKLGDIRKINAILNQFLLKNSIDPLSTEYFLIEEYKENKSDEDLIPRIADLNWPLIQMKIFEKLNEDDYLIKTPVPETDEDFFYYTQFAPLEEIIKTFCMMKNIQKSLFQKENTLQDSLCITENDLIHQIWNYLLNKNKKEISAIPSGHYVMLSILMKRMNLENWHFKDDCSWQNWIMLALNSAIYANNKKAVEKICILIETIADKCDIEKITKDKSIDDNGFYYLMSALSNATSKKESKIVEKICAIIELIFEKLTSETLTKNLLEKIPDSDFNGNENGIWLLIGAFYNVTLNNTHNCNVRAIQKISALAEKIIKKCGITTVVKGMSENITMGEYKGTNGFYWLMSALNNPSLYEDEDIEKISMFSKIIFESSDPKILSDCLAKKKAEGELIDRNGFYWLMAALNNAAYKKHNVAIEKICMLIEIIFNKCDSKSLANILSEKITNGKFLGMNIFDFLLLSMDKLLNKKINKSPIFDLFFNFLAKLKKTETPNNLQKQITDNKKKLRAVLVDYLKSQTKTSQSAFVGDPQTMLGALIDTRTFMPGFFQQKETNTRKITNKLFRQKTIDESHCTQENSRLHQLVFLR